VASRGKGANHKGQQFERDIAKKLSVATRYTFKRSLEQRRGGTDAQPDVFNDHWTQLHIECKRQKRCNIKAAMRQAINEQAEGGIPIAITKDDREEILVTMHIKDWMPFLVAWMEEQQK
jgi:hypothetical protein